MDTPSRSIAPAMLAATIDELRGHAPFDRMAREELQWLVERLSIVYFAPGATILGPADGLPEHFYIVKQGSVPGFGTDQTRREAPRWHLGTGECFPLGALIANRAVTSVYRAEGDVFCFRLDAPDFQALLARSPAFRDFATRRLATLVVESRRSQRSGTIGAGTSPLERPLRAVLPEHLVLCSPEATVRDCLGRMRAGRADSAVIVDDGGAAIGIFTLRDLRDRVALQDVPLDARVSSVMTSGPATLPAEALAFEAALLMAERGFRHVVVVDGERAVGCVSDGDLFAMQRVAVPGLAAAIRSADDHRALERAADGIRDLTRELAGDGMPAEQLTRMVATMNDLLTTRVVELEAAARGIAMDEFCWLAFGSEGRHEQTFATDQDNGLLLTNPVDATAPGGRERFVALGRSVNEVLALCGFPLCRGGVMAGNPARCLTMEEWQTEFRRWLQTPDGEALLNASIFFDLRPVCGNLPLGHSLREWISAATPGRGVFLRLLAENALRNVPPIGVVRDFVVGEHDGRRGTLDLKAEGTTLFVDAARVLSLAVGDAHSGTAARLRAVAAARQLAPAEVEGWLDAFHFIQQTRIDHQLRRLTQSLAPDNHVDPDSLNALDRRILKESLRQARKVQERLRLDFRL